MFCTVYNENDINSARGDNTRSGYATNLKAGETNWVVNELTEQWS